MMQDIRQCTRTAAMERVSRRLSISRKLSPFGTATLRRTVSRSCQHVEAMQALSPLIPVEELTKTTS
eukprot:8581462-Prorocentrum_lima.AAC.1